MLQVLYKVIGVSGWQTLFSTAQGATVLMPDFKGTAKFTDTKSPGFGSPSIQIVPMANVLITLPWKFDIVYASNALATASIRAMQAIGASQLHLQVIQDSEVQYYPNGTAESYEWEQTGLHVVHSFVFETQMVTTTQPTT